ncbi:PrgI family protein [Streptomyces sp. NBC_00237]|uniref:PrgI family protein n=1 Tax=Streptomyces sp. NBC_00237 TaxID=2975687 RepID=UPI00224EEEB9|nr:PrgI family protein [Streptomyces sp. NBC_00237]MCX5206918.1 PrgI family protein [Streptomyces sp. NBC_00237]
MTAPDEDEFVHPARIPADVAKSDRILGPLTARQTAILTVTGLVLYGGYWATRTLMHPFAYAALITPIALVITVIAVGQRDGIGLDHLLAAAVRFHRSPKRHVHAPEGIPALPHPVPPAWRTQTGRTPAALRLPCRDVSQTGTLDLGRDGHTALAVCSTLNFALRTGGEQQALTEAFARWLNSLTGPTQLLVRAHRLDVAPLVEDLTATAPTLPHPALEQAALTHAAFLDTLAADRDLLTRQVLLATHEPTTSGAPRASHRLAEAARALEAAEITVTALDHQGAGEVLRLAADPEATSLEGAF